MVCDIGQLETCRSDDAVLILRAICSRKLRMEVLVEERGSYITAKILAADTKRG